MSNQSPKIKKIVDTLSKGSESLRNNPTEQNYQEWEGKLDKAGNSTNWTPYIIAGVIAIMCVSAFFIFAGGVAISTASINNEASTNNSSLFKNVYSDQITNGYNQTGIRIHATFEVDNRKDVPCVAVVFFYDASGSALKDYNGSYATDSGQVATGQNFIPTYDNTEISDLLIFMPYEELHLGSGNTSLKYQIELYEKSSGALIAKSNYYSFSVTQ